MKAKQVWTRLKRKFSDTSELEKQLNDESILLIKNKKLSHGVDVAVRVLNSKVVRKATAAAKDVLDITEKVKSGNMLSIVAAGVSSLDTAAKFMDIERPDPYRIFIAENNLKETSRGSLIELISSPHVCDHIVREPGPVFENYRLVKYHLGEDNYIYTKFHNDAQEEQIKWYTDYLVPEDFSMEKAYDYLWSFYDGKAYVLKDSNKYFKDALQLAPLVMDDCDVLLDEGEIVRIIDEIHKSRKVKKSRSYLLIGPPGTGKTTLAFKTAERFANRVLKVDPSVLEKISCGELEQFVGTIQPDALMFDDIDRCSWRNEESLLFLFENLKRSFPEMVIFATANNYDRITHALRRPGRFDRIIWVLNPDWEQRAEFIEYFAKRLDIEIPIELFAETITESRGFSQAYLAEMLYRATMDVDLSVSLRGSVKEFKKTLLLEYREWEEEETIPEEYRAFCTVEQPASE